VQPNPYLTRRRHPPFMCQRRIKSGRPIPNAVMHAIASDSTARKTSTLHITISSLRLPILETCAPPKSCPAAASTPGGLGGGPHSSGSGWLVAAARAGLEAGQGRRHCSAASACCLIVSRATGECRRQSYRTSVHILATVHRRAPPFSRAEVFRSTEFF
jgi:hypothetical protein